jgi:hypothetical protein
MHVEDFNSAYRLGLGIALLYLLWIMVPDVKRVANLVVAGARQSQANASQSTKLSAANLEAALWKSKRFALNSQLRCETAARDWDYVCSYLPTPLQSQTRLQFGVNVDATQWVKVSEFVPFETTLPPPR